MAGIVSGIAKAVVAVGSVIFKSELVRTVAVNAAIAIGATYVQRALTKKKTRQTSGERLLDPDAYNNLRSNSFSSRQFIYGTTGIAGEIVFEHVHADKHWLSIVIALADGGQVTPHTLAGVRVDNEIVTFDVGGGAQGKYAGHMNLRFHGGHPDQTADAQLVTDAAGKWTTDHRGRSVAYVVWSLKLTNDTLYPNGRPDPLFIVNGRRCYDPRLDSTKAGGIGPHRIDDESTWEFTSNAALCAYDWARGIIVNGQKIGGIGLPADLIDESWIVASANACDEEGWEINGPIEADADPYDVLVSMALHMGGRVTTRKGKFAVIAGYDWPETITLGPNDLAGKLSLEPFRPWREAHNATRGVYRDADANYEVIETALIKVDSWVTEDGGAILETSTSTPLTNDREQSTRCAKIDLYRERAPRSFNAPWKLRAAQAQSGDIVRVTLPEYDIDETYEVVTRSLDVFGFVTLALRQWDTDAIAWSSEEAGDPPNFALIDRPDRTPDDPTEFAADGVSVDSASGSIPGIAVSGDPPTWIDAVVIEWREEGSSTWNLHSETAPS